MASDRPVRWKAVFFDGRSAVRHDVSVGIEAQDLVIDGYGAGPVIWDAAKLVSHAPPRAGSRVVLSSRDMPDTRLEVIDDAFRRSILALAPHLTITAARGRRFRIWLGAGLVAALGLVVVYLYLPVASGVLAPLVPWSWQDKMGTALEAQLTRKGGLCDDKRARTLLGGLVDRFEIRRDPSQPLQIKIWRTKLVNAFALPGGRVIVSTGLIGDAQGADELAGVIAHELGHVVKRHPTQQMIRVFGLLPIISVFFGQSSGFAKQLSELGALLVILRYTRDAEREADTEARRLMARAHVDPGGLKRFFERQVEKQGKRTATGLSFLSTHPALKKRISRLDGGGAKYKFRPAMSDRDWRVLKSACGPKTTSQ
jgi:Zn-dependent protease with chaperone function